MRIIVLASGSKGNSTYIESNDTKVLIDLGLSYAQTKKTLEEHDVDITEIKHVIITHLHSDHTLGLASFLKRNEAFVYTSKKNFKNLNKIVNQERIVLVENSFNLEDININFFHLSHDAPTIGLLIKIGDKEIVYATDTGYINYKYNEFLENKNIYIIESNHDEEMLLNGPYPYHLKRRIIGDSGHLSNKDSAKFLNEVIGDNTEIVCLAHISEHNNTPSLAYEEVSKIIGHKFNLDNLLVASQDESLLIYEEV